MQCQNDKYLLWKEKISDMNFDDWTNTNAFAMHFLKSNSNNHAPIPVSTCNWKSWELDLERFNEYGTA